MRSKEIQDFTEAGDFARKFPKGTYNQTSVSGEEIYFISCFLDQISNRSGGDPIYPFRAILKKGRPESENNVEVLRYHTFLREYENASQALMGGMEFLANEIQRAIPGLETRIVNEESPYILLQGSPDAALSVSPKRAHLYFEQMRASVGVVPH
ncbi:MAG: hypothetical protein Q8Q31_02215 [Nanoarchaeota archaeon]|nr:hypothetical protein [Nanoarchaeota archaeon]